ncbi:MAG: hypothetical protein ACPG9P_05800, partial [Candidatus Pseudothioglobus sp.]
MARLKIEVQLLKELSKPLGPASLTLLVRLSSIKGDASKCNLPKIFELMCQSSAGWFGNNRK